MQIEVARLFLLLIPTTLHICVKKMQSQKAFAIYSAYFVSHFFSYRAKCWACCHIIYLFIYIHLKIIEKSSRVFCVRKEYVGTWHSSAEICSLACFSLSLSLPFPTCSKGNIGI